MQELELIAAFEKGELDLPDVVLMTHLLIERGWVWQMPAAYQALAEGWISVGILNDPRKEKMDSRPKIKIIARDGYIKQIISEKGEIDVTLEEEGGGSSTFTASPNRSVDEAD